MINSLVTWYNPKERLPKVEDRSNYLLVKYKNKYTKGFLIEPCVYVFNDFHYIDDDSINKIDGVILWAYLPQI